jgi:hypothetical protein
LTSQKSSENGKNGDFVAGLLPVVFSGFYIQVVEGVF